MTNIQDVLVVLERVGYRRLAKPLTVVGTEFDFEAAASGTDTSHDLVLVATDQVSQKRLQRLVAGLARSLDIAASRRPVSLVLIGGIHTSDRTELERYARVLPIASPTPSTADIEKAIAVLLPLKLPNAELASGGDAINEVMKALGSHNTTPDHVALIQVSADGPAAVREALRRFANDGTGWTDKVDNDVE